MERDFFLGQDFQFWFDFNSHAHVERDAPDVQSKFYDSNFNSHAHVERDAEVAENTYIHMDFNSHAHVERDEIK